MVDIFVKIPQTILQPILSLIFSPFRIFLGFAYFVETENFLLKVF